MARAVDHYAVADALAASLTESFDDMKELEPDEAATMAPLLLATLAFGQLHATLALAGATALQAYSTGDENELADWEHAAGGTS